VIWEQLHFNLISTLCRFDYPKIEDFSMPEAFEDRSVDKESSSTLHSTLQCPKQLVATEVSSSRMKVTEFPDSIAYFKGIFTYHLSSISLRSFYREFSNKIYFL
jgi:hypothetical protein